MPCEAQTRRNDSVENSVAQEESSSANRIASRKQDLTFQTQQDSQQISKRSEVKEGRGRRLRKEEKLVG